MNPKVNPKYRNITISGKYATGTTTLAKNLVDALGWKHVNVGEIQRRYDREHGRNENKQGALDRPDEHERRMEAMTEKMLKEEDGLIYEAWLAGFVAKDISEVLKILLYCSDEAILIDRVVNRDGVSVEEAKQYIKQREMENEIKWKKLYGDHDFWNPKSKFYDLVINTYGSGPMQTLGTVLDKLNSKK